MQTMTRVLRVAIALVPLAVAASCRDYSPPPGPDQPIAFYHTVHARDNQIPCMYCHYSADRSSSAGIPSVQQCVGCHVPASGTPTHERGAAQLAFPTAERNEFWNQEAEKLVDYWRRGEAIPWVRIHKIPEHAQFPHYVHVNVGLECQTCHGPVQDMEKVYQFSSLRMGWCIDCHRGEMPLSDTEEQAVRERSSFVRKIAALREQGADVRGVDATYPNQRAATDCFVCHY
jgi:hypothetical protein